MNLTQNQKEWLITSLFLIYLVFSCLINLFFSNFMFFYFVGAPFAAYLGRKGKWVFPSSPSKTNKYYIVLGIVLYLIGLPVLYLSYQEPFDDYKTFLGVLIVILSVFGSSFLLAGIGDE